MKKFLLLGFLLSEILLAGCGRKPDQPWANLAPGTSVTFEETSTVAGLSHTRTLVMTLVRATATESVVSVTVDGGAAREISLPIRPDEPKAPKPPDKIEKLRIDGRDFDCDVYEVESTKGTAVVRIVNWIHGNGRQRRVLKSITQCTEHGVLVSETTATTETLAEKVAVGSETFLTRRNRTLEKYAKGQIETVEWECESFPEGVVRRTVETQETGRGSTRTDLRATKALIVR